MNPRIIIREAGVRSVPNQLGLDFLIPAIQWPGKKNILKLIEKQSQKEKEAIVGNSLHNIVKVENKYKVQLGGRGETKVS